MCILADSKVALCHVMTVKFLLSFGFGVFFKVKICRHFKLFWSLNCHSCMTLLQGQVTAALKTQ